MARDMPELERVGAVCGVTYDVTLCKAAEAAAWGGVGRWFNGMMGEGGRDPYDDRQNCTKPPFCGHLGFKRITTYLNAPWVQTNLGVDNHTYSPNTDILTMMWQASGAVAVPTTREVSWILDHTDLDVLVINGNNNIVCNTPGNIRVYDNLRWHQQARYRLRRFQDWFDLNAIGERLKGGQMKGAGKLWFASVDEAGHESPKQQPLAVKKLVNRRIWGEREDHLRGS